MTITKEKTSKLDAFIREANHIVITSHKSPDGDSIGSSLGLFHYLKAKNKTVVICHPDVAPNFLHWMTGFDQILSLDQHEKQVTEHFKQTDLIFCLDYNSPSRIGQLEKLMNESQCRKVMIDHHRDPDEDFCDLMFSDITACSTSQLIYEVIRELGDIQLMNEIIGTPLYAGIVTDTGSFRFSSTQPKTHLIVADLMERGVKHWKVHENIFDTNSLNRMKLVSFALLEKLVVLDQYQTAYISLSSQEQAQFNPEKGDTEGLVNQALSLHSVKLAVFFKEDDGIVKISFRSKDSIPANELAKAHFGGGGHLNAAGGKFVGTIEHAIDKFVTILPTFVQENKACFE